MHIEFAICRSDGYFRALVRPRVLPVVRRMILSSVASALAGPLMIVVSEGEGVGAAVGFLCIAAAAGLALCARRVYAAALLPPDGWSSRRTYIITEQGLSSRTDATSSSWDWSVVRGAEVYPTAYVFHQDGPIFDVPREPLTNDEDAELSGFLANRGIPLKSKK